MNEESLISLKKYIILLLLVVVFDANAQQTEQSKIDSFFLNNDCDKLEISFFMGYYNFVFTPTKSFVKFDTGETDLISSQKVARVLSLVDSLKLNYSPIGSKLYVNRISGLFDKCYDSTFLFVTYKGRYLMFERDFSFPLRKYYNDYFYNPLFLKLIEFLSDIMTEIGKSSDCHFFASKEMKPWPQSYVEHFFNKQCVIKDWQNTLKLMPAMNCRDYFKYNDVKSIEIVRETLTGSCRIRFYSNGMVKVSLGKEKSTRYIEISTLDVLVSIISQYDLAKYGLLDWAVMERIPRIKDEPRKNMGYVGIYLFKNDGGITRQKSFLPLVDNIYCYIYRPEFLELLKLVDSLAVE